MRKRIPFDTILTAPEMNPKWSIQNKLNFHRFNPNGLYARWKGNCDKIWGAIDKGQMKGGAYFAYGYGSHDEQNLMEAKQVSRIQLQVILGMLKDSCERQEESLKRVEEAA